MFITIEQFKQNIQKNRLKIKELPERKIGEKKSKIGSSLDTLSTGTAVPTNLASLVTPLKQLIWQDN